MTPAAASPEAERFFAGALERIRRLMLAFAVLAVGVAWVWWGTAVAAGLSVGCLVAFVNFIWLKQIVSAMADRITGAPTTGAARASIRGPVLRYLLRYVFLGVAAYVIFRVSEASLYGFLAGLFLPVAAILCEAGYEWTVALRRGV